MKHLKENPLLKLDLGHIYSMYFPTKRDNLFQIILKLLFIIVLAVSVTVTSYFTVYFSEIGHQQKIIKQSQMLWKSSENDLESVEKPSDSKIMKTFLSRNKDFKGWLKMGGGEISSPVYQTDNNSFYLNHNSLREKGSYGALFFDKSNKITDKKVDSNLIIYGSNMPDGSLFGNLYKLRSLNYLRKNYRITLTLPQKVSTYKIFAVFVLNASKKDDNGYVFNIYRQGFNNVDEFYYWTSEAVSRSLIKTKVDIMYDDSFLTLVTDSDDFENSRLVVLAREVREGESTLMSSSDFSANLSPRYPQKWYTERGIGH